MVNSNYKVPFLFRNGHLHTIYPNLFRRVNDVSYRRERIDTPDRDFLDLDWSKVGSDSLAVISHGLEGDSHRSYVKGMVRAMNQAGIDALAWNFRGCSGEPNRLLGLYHNGSIGDLHTVVSHAAPAYKNIFLVGFSMGGNMSLLYLGKQAQTIPGQVKGCVVFSVPCDLTDASLALARTANTLYMKRFLRLLHDKIKMKKAQFPQQIDDDNYHRLKSFADFDGRYTAPIHGFDSAEDYWRKCSCRPWLERIKLPSLIVNALDDPFLADGCYPVAECSGNPQLTLEITRYGGHVGFMALNRQQCYWSEERAVTFVRELLSVK